MDDHIIDSKKFTHIYQFFIPLIIGIKEFLKFNRYIGKYVSNDIR